MTSCPHPLGVACGCNQPDSCIHTVKVSGGGLKAEYKQSRSLPTLYVQDKTGKGVSVDVEIVGKSCATSNPDCPSGRLWSQDLQEVHPLKEGKNNVLLQYKPTLSANLGTMFLPSMALELIDFLKAVIYRDVAFIPCTHYVLSVSECHGDNRITELYRDIFGGNTFFEPVIQAIVATHSEIVVFPKYEWSIGLSIGSSYSKQEFTVKERRDAQIARSRAEGKTGSAKKLRAGWSLFQPEGKSVLGVTLKGSNEVTIGDTTKTLEFELLKQQFEKYHNQMPLLSEAERTLRIAEQMTSDSNQKDQVKLLKFDMLLPALSLEGKAVLALTDAGQPHMEGSLVIGMKPLIGFKLTIDIIQVIAMTFGVSAQIAELREVMQKQEREFGKDENVNRAYFALQGDLIFETSVNATVKFASTEQGKPWALSLAPASTESTFNQPAQTAQKQGAEVKGAAVNTQGSSSTASGGVEGNVAVQLALNIRAGAKVAAIGGWFRGKATLNAGARVMTKGFYAIDPIADDKGGLKCTLYHDGVWGEVYFDTEFKVSVGDDETNVTDNSVFNSAGAENSKINSFDTSKASVKRKLVQFYDPLPKDKGPSWVAFRGDDL